MSCSCVVCLPCCVLLLDSSRFVAIVRILSSTLGSASFVHLLRGLVLLPCGNSGKMTATLDLNTIFAMLVSSFYRYAALPIPPVYQAIPNCHEPLTFDTFPMQTSKLVQIRINLMFKLLNSKLRCTKMIYTRF